MGDIRYSICATHYNNGEYIRESAGVFADLIENHPEWELIVTDAGSDDGSLEYLQALANEQDNVRLIIEEGTNIGQGRRLAARAARGEILVQVMDLDAEYYQDERLFEIMAFYEQLLETEGEVMLSAGVNFCTTSLLKELGGWKDLIACEETEIKRRALREGKLRFCPLEFFEVNAGLSKNFRDGVERFYHNSSAKFQAGVGFWYMLYYWLRYAPGIRPKLGAVIVFPIAYYNVKSADSQVERSYDKHDPYIMGFKSTVYEHHPEFWIKVPDDLEEYAAEDERRGFLNQN